MHVVSSPRSGHCLSCMPNQRHVKTAITSSHPHRLTDHPPCTPSATTRTSCQIQTESASHPPSAVCHLPPSFALTPCLLIRLPVCCIVHSVVVRRMHTSVCDCAISSLIPVMPHPHASLARRSPKCMLKTQVGLRGCTLYIVVLVNFCCGYCTQYIVPILTGVAAEPGTGLLDGLSRQGNGHNNAGQLA